jgi:GTP-binding protein Era
MKVVIMEINKSAIIAITGRPNVGKSTLVNRFVGEKVSIVTNKPQTTRKRIYAILNRGDTQLVFVDTPGFHKPRSLLGRYMVNTVRESMAGVDAIVLMVEPYNNIGGPEEHLIEHIKKSGLPSVLIINKIDTTEKSELLGIIETYSKHHAFEHIIPISALSGDGVEQLLDILDSYAIEGPALFPEDMITDQPERQIVAEMVREKLLICLEHEIPHGPAVEVTRFSERQDNEIIDIDVTIFCEKQSHKRIIIGKNGTMIKKIGELARKDIERFMGTKVFLQTWVKVRENWRDKSGMLKNFGYYG